MKILVVEDDAPLSRSLAASFAAAGHEPHTVASGAAALGELEARAFDAMVLDIGLPDIDGFEILARLRRAGSDLPIVVLTARDAVPDRVAGLDMGADDYVLKPFEPEELAARVRAVVRRKRGAAANLLVVGALTCDLESGAAAVGGRPLDLRPREWTALKVLASRPARVVSREQLVAEMFPDEAAVSPNVLDVHVGRLRRKLKPDGPGIRTLRGVGYRLDP
ncbi:response regulator transcription factor [Phenylobacterium sp. J426]|uniref:response regulator transcription factor n=1 Tax=Phenylobacterium sp. J426 TaxID=2898439 RepID=UPI002150C263|nr:response regulator transcription factor [Phenylobacterium sp. J426]MCR5876262.1 response regulator transcription factor [Phenylobacterium sp. J426]